MCSRDDYRYGIINDIRNESIGGRRNEFTEGRPKKYSRQQINHALDLLENHSYRQVCQMTGISKSTLIRAKKHKK